MDKIKKILSYNLRTLVCLLMFMIGMSILFLNCQVVEASEDEIIIEDLTEWLGADKKEVYFKFSNMDYDDYGSEGSEFTYYGLFNDVTMYLTDDKVSGISIEYFVDSLVSYSDESYDEVFGDNSDFYSMYMLMLSPYDIRDVEAVDEVMEQYGLKFYSAYFISDTMRYAEFYFNDEYSACVVLGYDVGYDGSVILSSIEYGFLEDDLFDVILTYDEYRINRIDDKINNIDTEGLFESYCEDYGCYQDESGTLYTTGSISDDASFIVVNDQDEIVFGICPLFSYMEIENSDDYNGTIMIYSKYPEENGEYKWIVLSFANEDGQSLAIQYFDGTETVELNLYEADVEYESEDIEPESEYLELETEIDESELVSNEEDNALSTVSIEYVDIEEYLNANVTTVLINLNAYDNGMNEFYDYEYVVEGYSGTAVTFCYPYTSDAYFPCYVKVYFSDYYFETDAIVSNGYSFGGLTYDSDIENVYAYINASSDYWELLYDIESNSVGHRELIFVTENYDKLLDITFTGYDESNTDIVTNDKLESLVYTDDSDYIQETITYASQKDAWVENDQTDSDLTVIIGEEGSANAADVAFDKDWYQKYTYSDGGGNNMSFSWLDDGYFGIEFDWGSYSAYDLDSGTYSITGDGYYHYEGDGYAIEYDAVNNAVLFIPGAGGSSWFYAN
ncbi:MAG: hypothetical protein LIP10_15870 [Clostridiales bacterium]|nr:hypothetical protein [Clostridiales bacterium]